MALVIITGGGGFLGQCLASTLLTRGTIQTETSADAVKITKIVLADIAFPPKLQPIIEQNSNQVSKCQGDVSSKSFCDSLFTDFTEKNTTEHVSVFHLGAVMSGDGERDFDLCMRVNLHGLMNMLESARTHIYTKLSITPKFVFASAGATIGSGAATDYVSKEDIISDSIRATPHTTYGMTKACAELLVSDYSRRGFVDGRGIRLPSIIVRAGSPNAATTSCFSAVIREPLNGVDVTLPIADHVLHAVTGKRSAIDAMVRVHDCQKEVIERVLGFDRTVFLPAVAVSLGDLESALKKVVTNESHDKLGKISYKVDEFLSDVVSGFPTKIDAARALELGVPDAPTAETLVREYIEDFPLAVVDGIEIVLPPAATTATPVSVISSDEKVAVITGGGSGIGRGVAQRLSLGGWTVVLAGRTMKTLQQTQSTLHNTQKCLCVKTDISIEREVQSLFQKIESVYGKVDLLFNNAGINSTAASVEHVTSEDFDKIMRTNVAGPFMCAKYAMTLMAKHNGGRIINNGSISAHTPRPGSICYTTSKHAVLGLTKCIALDGRGMNVACGQIDFGNVVSEMSLKTNDVKKGATQANGSLLVEPSMSMKDAAETFWAMANLPLEANVLQMTVMATGMPFVGRG